MQDLSLDQTIHASAVRILDHQKSDGAFSFCCEVRPFSDAMMVIFLHLLGEHRDPLIPQVCRVLQSRQDADGAWRAYADQRENLSITVLVYFALLLSGHPKRSEHMMRARKYIVQRGGITEVSNMTKVALAAAGQLPWSTLPHPQMEAILRKPSDLVSLYDFASFARLHIASYMLLSHLQFHYRVPDDKSLRDLIRPSFVWEERPTIQRNHRAIEACHVFLRDRLEPNGTLASYLTATVFAVFAFQALGYGRDDAVIQRAIHGLRDMVYRRGHDVHPQLFSSTVWDTSLCMHALHVSRLQGLQPRLRRAASYLLSKQQRRLSDWSIRTRSTAPGGWGFSDVNTLYPDVDDSIAALKALHPYRRCCPLHWNRGVKWVLAMQNDDGGWSAFDRNSNKWWLELLPINDMGRAMTDPSTSDLTGRVLETIRYCRIPATAPVQRGVEWLLRQQGRDGAWFGRWGIAYLYGTWAAVLGLRASGVDRQHTALVRAQKWLQEVQRPDGGFGESCRSDDENQYIPGPFSTASQTAWGLMALLGLSDRITPNIERAAQFLIDASRPRGGWKESYPTGAGVAGLAYLRYHSYPQVWPLLALARYRKRLYRERLAK